MKKIVLGFIAGLILLPTPSYAITEEGIEYLSPLVQTIITLLQERIAELSAEVSFLKGNTPVCVYPFTPTPTVTTQTPQTGGIIVNMPEISKQIVVSQRGVGKKDPVNGEPFGSYAFWAGYTEDGEYKKDVQITLTAPTDLYRKSLSKSPNSVSSNNGTDWTASFNFTPESAGQHTLTFSVGETTEVVVLNVE